MYCFSLAIARTAALVLYVDVVFILLPVCRNFISLLRRTPLNDIIPFDKAITFHKATAWSIVAFTVIHISAHMVNFYRLAMTDPSKKAGDRFIVFLQANFATGPGVTGWIMTACLFVMVWYATEKRRRARFEAFWYTHHLFILFFICWQLHGMFCMIQPDRPPYCSFNNIGVFWVCSLSSWLDHIVHLTWNLVSATGSSEALFGLGSVSFVKFALAIGHTSLKSFSTHQKSWNYRSRKKRSRPGPANTYTCPVLKFLTSSGTHSLSPGLSFLHPDLLATYTPCVVSAPEEDYISLHIRVVGDFTSALARSVGCEFESKSEKESPTGGKVVPPPLNRVLPRVMIDGPFGSASEDFLKFETVLLVGGGIGVTPFAS
jgi:predicted ferric reductase